MSDKTRDEERPDIKALDGLIDKCYEKLVQLMENNPKVGDLIRMIELRRKLLPNEDDQKRFWSRLEAIRRQVLEDGQQGSNGSSPSKQGHTSEDRRKGSGGQT